MAKPSEKSSQLESFFEATMGRTTAIKSDKCLPSPTGCGGDAVEFTDALSQREYSISGFCQKCQDTIFSGERE